MSTYPLVLDALANPTRRHLFELIKDRPRSVTDLAEAMPVSQPAISQHLRVLREAQLVAWERDGARRIYHISHRGLGILRRYIESFWDDALEATQRSLELEGDKSA